MFWWLIKTQKQEIRDYPTTQDKRVTKFNGVIDKIVRPILLATYRQVSILLHQVMKGITSIVYTIRKHYRKVLVPHLLVGALHSQVLE